MQLCLSQLSFDEKNVDFVISIKTLQNYHPRLLQYMCNELYTLAKALYESGLVVFSQSLDLKVCRSSNNQMSLLMMPLSKTENANKNSFVEVHSQL